MEQFLNDLNYMLIGAAIGYFFHPIFAIAKKIIKEARQAQKEWRDNNK